VKWFNFDWERMEDLAKELNAIWMKIKEDIIIFIE
jgi:hypothetical protein